MNTREVMTPTLVPVAVRPGANPRPHRGRAVFVLHRVLALPRQRVLRRWHGGNMPVLRGYDGGKEKFFRTVLNGRKNTPMGGFKGILSEDEVSKIYEYLMSLKKT